MNEKIIKIIFCTFLGAPPKKQGKNLYILPPRSILQMLLFVFFSMLLAAVAVVKRPLYKSSIITPSRE